MDIYNRVTFSFFLLLDEHLGSFFPGTLDGVAVRLRFLPCLAEGGDISPAPSWRRLSFRGLPVRAIAVRDRIMSV